LISDGQALFDTDGRLTTWRLADARSMPLQNLLNVHIHLPEERR
jgi:hypothetical protein